MRLITEEELAAEHLVLPLKKVQRLRQERKWPHVRLGRFEVRYTEAQVEEIVAQHSAQPRLISAAPASILDGQTKRSANRGRSS